MVPGALEIGGEFITSDDSTFERAGPEVFQQMIQGALTPREKLEPILKSAGPQVVAAGAEESRAAGVNAMSPGEIAAVMAALREVAEGPDVVAAIRATTYRIGLRSGVSRAAGDMLGSDQGIYLPADAPAPVVFQFDHRETWAFAPLVAKTGARVAVLVDEIAVAAGMEELFRRAGVPEGQYAVVSREAFGWDDEAALNALKSRFPAGVDFVTVPPGTGLADVERFLRERGVIFYTNAAAGAEEIDRYMRSLA